MPRWHTCGSFIQGLTVSALHLVKSLMAVTSSDDVVEQLGFSPGCHDILIVGRMATGSRAEADVDDMDTWNGGLDASRASSAIRPR
jgi:hypothetical protein